VKPRLREGGIEAIADPKLGDDYPKDVFQDMAELGLECSSFDKEDRPSMKVTSLSYQLSTSFSLLNGRFNNVLHLCCHLSLSRRVRISGMFSSPVTTRQW